MGLANGQMAALHESLLALPLQMLLAYARLAHMPQMMEPTAPPTPLVETKPMAQPGSPVQLQLLQGHAPHALRALGPQLLQTTASPPPTSLPPALANGQMAALHESLLALPLRMLRVHARLAHGLQMMQPTALPTPFSRAPALASRKMAALHESLLALARWMLRAHARLAHGLQMV